MYGEGGASCNVNRQGKLEIDGELSRSGRATEEQIIADERQPQANGFGWHVGGAVLGPRVLQASCSAGVQVDEQNATFGIDNWYQGLVLAIHSCCRV